MEKVEGGYFHEAKLVDPNGSHRTIRLPVVQELMRQGFKDLPEGFLAELPPNQPVADFPTVTIPVIDVAKLRVGGSDPVGRSHELAKLATAASGLGVFLITNHTVPDSVLGRVEEVVKGFFGLSFEEKKESVGTYMSKDNMGYGRNFMESEFKERGVYDWVDRLTMKAAPKEATQGLHVWPNNPPNFRNVIEEYVEEARKVCNELLEALAETLSLERHAFLQYFPPEQSDITFKANYYPPCPRPDQALGFAAHSDGSAFTVLMQFGSSGGLQVLQDGKWATIAWPPNTLLVNIGDLIEIMSNGKFKSCWHRVVTQLEADRFSVGLFYKPPPRTEIEPVQDENAVDGYKKVVVEDYLSQLYRSREKPTFKQGIMFAKA